jgi:UDP-glucose:(heptosyl)LPS alpha-1,3-glucosyltransferase
VGRAARASLDLLVGKEVFCVRVALVFSRFHRQGGTERQVHMLARDLAADGHEVHVFCRLVRASPPEGVSLHVMPRLPLGPLLELVLFSAWARRAIAAHERRHGPFDVRHGFGRTLGQDVYRVGGGSHHTYLEHAHALDKPPWMRRLLGATPLQRLKAAMEARALRGDPAATVITNSAMVRDDLARRHDLPAERTVVIRNGVDLDLFRPPEPGEREHVRTPWGLDESHEVALMVGSGYARKGVEPALRAVARLAEARPALRLVVAGKDRKLQHWKALAESLDVADRVVWLGPCITPETTYRGADVFMLPTAYDAAANSTLEALASGLPVITSAMNGAAEILEPERHGEIVPTPVHPDDLARALSKWLGRSDRARVAAEVRELATHYPAVSSCERVLAVYRALVDRKPLPGALP